MFKYLLQVLDHTEFEKISFYNVNRFIETVFNTKQPQQDKSLSKKTLKEFIYHAVDLQYMQSPQSKKALNLGMKIF